MERRELLATLISAATLAAAPHADAAPQRNAAIASEGDLTEPWKAVEFAFEAEAERVPGIVIKLPGERWYASTLICPHAQCVLRYFTDVAVARDTFDVAVQNPVLGCPCHFSVFDVANAGKVLSGPATQPPLQLRVEVVHGEIFVGQR